MTAAVAACTRSPGAGTVPSTDTYESGGGHTSDTGSPRPATGDTGPIFAAPLEVCLNEFMPRNVAAWPDETGAFGDWIEIHNPGDEAIDLRGWALTDDRAEPDKHEIRDELPIEAGGFVVLWADALPDLGPTHLSFALDEDGEEVGLFRRDGSGEVVAFGGVVGDVAVARDTDCGPIEGWSHVFVGTPGATNAP